MNKFISFYLIFTITLVAASHDLFCPEEGTILLPHPNNCAKFLTCSNGELDEYNCPEGLLWNNQIEMCDRPENAQCVVEENNEIDVIDGSGSGSGSGSGDEPGPVGECPPINGEFVDFLPHSHDCTMYYVCDWGVPIEMHCGKGTHFNPILNVCDHPDDAGCTAGY